MAFQPSTAKVGLTWKLTSPCVRVPVLSRGGVAAVRSSRQGVLLPSSRRSHWTAIRSTSLLWVGGFAPNLVDARAEGGLCLSLATPQEK